MVCHLKTIQRIQPPKAQTHCEHPAYLFWKIQAHLTRLNNRLVKQRLHAK